MPCISNLFLKLIKMAKLLVFSHMTQLIYQKQNMVVKLKIIMPILFLTLFRKILSTVSIFLNINTAKFSSKKNCKPQPLLMKVN
ncbi:Uncharacterised protein [Acinetobacter baumannii]|nr:Uncharacterised protein [Acinetobacter baumannii]